MVIYILWLLCMLWLFKINFRGFRRFVIHGGSSYVVLYTQCLRYNIYSAWFLDIRISTCLAKWLATLYKHKCIIYTIWLVSFVGFKFSWISWVFLPTKIIVGMLRKYKPTKL